MTSIKWNGKEVTKQPQRALVATFAVVFGLLGALFGLVMLVVVIPLSLPIHFLVRLFNGRGFSEYTGRTHTYNVPWWGLVLTVLLYVVLVLAFL